MRHPIKIIIKKRKPLGYSWIRYHEIERLLITGHGIIQTEAQLAYYIYRKFGIGRYQVMAWQRGYEGFWIYWLGDIMDNGFLRDVNRNKELDKLKQEFNQADSYTEKSMIESEIELTREISETKTKRRGPLGLKMLRPGVMHEYEVF